MLNRAVSLCVFSATIALTLALGSIAAAGSAAANGPQSGTLSGSWSDAEDLSAAGQNATEPQMAMSGDARFQTATWFGHDGVSSNIYVTASEDSGSTWSPATMLTASVPTGDAYDPRIAVSAEGRYQTITWYRLVGVSNVVQSRTSSDFGATWAPVVDMSTAGAAAATASVAMSSDGRYQTITWRRNNGSHNIVQARTSSDFGATWTLAVDLSAVGGSAWMPQVDLSADGRYQSITWYRPDAGRNVIQSRSSSDYGVTWATVVAQSAPGQDAYNPRIAVSDDGRYQSITWYRYDGSRNVVQARSSSDFGATWESAALDLSSPPGSATMPRIAMSASGQHLTITWESFDGSRVVQVSSSSDYGATWAATADLTATGNNAEQPQVALSADGQVQTVTWWRLSGGIANVQVVQARTSDDFGVTWAAAVDLSTPTTDSYSPALAMSADGRSQVVAWYLYMGSYYSAQASFFSVSDAVSTIPGPATYFTFLLPDGRECTAISPMRVQVGTMVELPGVDALCHTMDGSTVAGWTIPVPNGFTGYGSTVVPFPPGLKVRVIDSQRFTLVSFEPILQIDYDANVAAADTCAPADFADTSHGRRVAHEWVPREILAMARTPLQAPCVPKGYQLTGWNTAGDGTGTAIGLGAPLPQGWATGPVNDHQLYAIWRPTS